MVRICNIIRNLINYIISIDLMDLLWLGVCGVLVRSELKLEVGILLLQHVIKDDVVVEASCADGRPEMQNITRISTRAHGVST
jgi:hypothetical protein